MFKKMILCFAAIGFAGSLTACGKSVEAKCEELVKSTTAVMGDLQKTDKAQFDQLVKTCVASGGPK